jgi:hypothetical protein
MNRWSWIVRTAWFRSLDYLGHVIHIPGVFRLIVVWIIDDWQIVTAPSKPSSEVSVESCAGNPYWKGRISTVNLLVLISSRLAAFNTNTCIFLNFKTSCLNQEVNCTESSPSVRIPCTCIQNLFYLIVVNGLKMLLPKEIFPISIFYLQCSSFFLKKKRCLPLLCSITHDDDVLNK